MTDHQHARPDQWVTAGLMAVMTVSYLAFMGWCVWRDVQARRDMIAFRNRVQERMQQVHTEPELDARQLEGYR